MAIWFILGFIVLVFFIIIFKSLMFNDIETVWAEEDKCYISTSKKYPGLFVAGLSEFESRRKLRAEIKNLSS